MQLLCCVNCLEEQERLPINRKKSTLLLITCEQCVLSLLSHVQLFAILWMVASQAPHPWASFLQGILLTQGSDPSLLCLMH